MIREEDTSFYLSILIPSSIFSFLQLYFVQDRLLCFPPSTKLTPQQKGEGGGGGGGGTKTKKQKSANNP